MSEDIQTETEIEINKRTEETKIILMQGDITSLPVDAIVNAAHEQLTGGGGVDGAIHTAAGPKLLGECLNLYGCPVGEARITSAYDLPSKYVIHTVGPVYIKSKHKECEKELASCYQNCIRFAEMQGLKSIAFPCISTGAFAFPKKDAAKIAINTIHLSLSNPYGVVLTNKDSYLNEIIICCFDNDNYIEYKSLFTNLVDNETTLSWEIK